MAAPRKTTKTDPTPERNLHMFTVTPEQLTEGVKRGGGRAPSISKYHDDVQAAAQERGTTFGIGITDTDKATTIVSQLRIAAKAHGVKIKVMIRDKAATPFVGFVVLPDEHPATAE